MDLPGVTNLLAVSGTNSSRNLARGQGIYFLATGMWPLVSIRSFQTVTGPKRDLWLVKTVGLLVSAIGATLITAGARKHVSKESRLLAMITSTALAGVDINYSVRGRISKIYLLDALAELGLVALWLSQQAGKLNEVSRKLQASLSDAIITKTARKFIGGRKSWR